MHGVALIGEDDALPAAEPPVRPEAISRRDTDGLALGDLRAQRQRLAARMHPRARHDLVHEADHTGPGGPLGRSERHEEPGEPGLGRGGIRDGARRGDRENPQQRAGRLPRAVCVDDPQERLAGETVLRLGDAPRGERVGLVEPGESELDA